MKAKITNIDTLESKIISIKHGTFEEVLHEAASEFNDNRLEAKDNLICNGDICKLIFDDCTYFIDIVYKGIPKSELKQTRKMKDWTEEKNKLLAVYKESMTAKQLSIKSGVNLGQVYYLSKLFDIKLKAGQRGRRKH